MAVIQSESLMSNLFNALSDFLQTRNANTLSKHN